MPLAAHRTLILASDTAAAFAAAVAAAAERLRAGQLVALPTETVYGLAANALDPAAVARIFAVKGRPAHNPIIVHVASLDMARRCAGAWPELAARFAAAFWPGPLTLVVPRAAGIPDIVTAGGATVGLRWPSHPLMRAVIEACGFPLAAPSANLSNELSPTTAAHVERHLAGRIGLIVDGGPCPVGIESTVLDVSVRPPRVLRPGTIHAESLRAVARDVSGLGTAPAQGAERADLAVGAIGATGAAAGPGPLRSPGQLRRHYAPRAPLVLWRWRDETDLRGQLAAWGTQWDRVHVVAHACVPSGAGLGGVSVVPHDAAAFARALYAELHRCDLAGAELIVVETPPETSAWTGVHDRLRRASEP